MTIAIPLLVALVGAILYFVGGGKTQEIGRAMMWCGLLATLLSLEGKHLHFS